MKIAIIGGGKRCKAFLEMFDARRFPGVNAQVVAVADLNEEAVGIRLAREMQVFTTRDYRDFCKIADLDLVIELTGRQELLHDFLNNYPGKVRVLDADVLRLFGDVIQLREEYLSRQRHKHLIENMVKDIFQSMSDPVLLIRPDFTIVEVNQALLNLTGMEQKDVVGRFCYEINHRSAIHCSAGGVHCPLEESLETGTAANTIHEHLDCHGQSHYCELVTMPLKGTDGNIDLVVEVVHDITDQLARKVEEKILTLKKDLMRLVYEEKMISLGKLAASAVHEINNPLSGINSLARLVREELESGEIDAAAKERFIHYLGLIDSESARCSGIVRDMLHFSRQTRGIRSKFQPNELIEKALNFVRFRLDSQGIEVRTELDPELPPMMGDQSQIEQCLLNLIFNAVDAMPDGGELVLRTSPDRSASLIRLEVADNGIGIPEKTIPFIFEPFFSTKSHDRGVGLGLSVVYGIVKGHGGSVYVKSKEGAGARFILKFPVDGDAR